MGSFLESNENKSWKTSGYHLRRQIESSKSHVLFRYGRFYFCYLEIQIISIQSHLISLYSELLTIYTSLASYSAEDDTDLDALTNLVKLFDSYLKQGIFNCENRFDNIEIVFKDEYPYLMIQWLWI